MATSNQDTNIKDVAAPASATTTNIGHVLGLNAAKTQDVLIPLSMLRAVIAAELKTALAAITSGSPDVPVLDGNNLKYMTLANFAKVVGGLAITLSEGDANNIKEPGDFYWNASSAANISNIPINTAGLMKVEKFAGHYIQRVVTYNGSKEYRRTYYGQWYPWYEISLNVVS